MTFRALGIALVVVALVVAFVPMFNNCTAEGLSITTKDGRQIDMKCFWTARAELGIAIPLLAVGVFVAMSKSKSALTALAVVGGLLSALAIALPTQLIGVCMMDKTCLNVMKPAMMVTGAIGVAVCIAIAVFASRMDEGLAE